MDLLSFGPTSPVRMSDAIYDPHAYTRLTDHIVQQILMTTSPELEEVCTPRRERNPETQTSNLAISRPVECFNHLIVCILVIGLMALPSGQHSLWLGYTYLHSW